ncbi:MAG: hypothetical protein HQK54_09230, partial [Oligoflexales bacterium]|nr:hypothetical protein [Oligoflexales bacterium]
FYDPVITSESESCDLFHYGRGPAYHDGIDGTDCSRIEKGYVTISVLKPSLLCNEKNDEIRDRLRKVDDRKFFNNQVPFGH